MIQEQATCILTGIDSSLRKEEVEDLIIEHFMPHARLVDVCAHRRSNDSGKYWCVRVVTFTENETNRLIKMFNGIRIGNNKNCCLHFERINIYDDPKLIIKSNPLHFCQRHCQSIDESDLDIGCRLVKFPTMRYFERAVHLIIEAHYKREFPLRSFMYCYRAVMKEDVQINEKHGVQLEYLLSSLPNVLIILNRNGVKIIKEYSIDDMEDAEHYSLSYSITPIKPILRSFGHEVCQILKKKSHCQIALHELIGEYKKTINECVSFSAKDYGENSVYDMILKLNNMCLLMGEDYGMDNPSVCIRRPRMLTLQPNIQRRRFIQKIISLLSETESASSSSDYYSPDSLNVSANSASSSSNIVYFEDIKRKFELNGCTPKEYGAFCFDELLFQVSSSKELVRHFSFREEDGALVPKLTSPNLTYEQTKTLDGFATDVILMLREWPNCSIPFHQFIPLYHHVTKHQCKVEAYGVNKLEDLLNAISSTIVLKKDENNIRTIQLVPRLMTQILRENVQKLLYYEVTHGLCVEDIEQKYAKFFGIPIVDYKLLQKNSVYDMLLTLSPSVIDLIDSTNLRKNITLNLTNLNAINESELVLLKQMIKHGKVSIKFLDQPAWIDKYFILSKYCNEDGELKPLAKFARIVCYILTKSNVNTCDLASFESKFHKEFGTRLKPQLFGSLFVDRLFAYLSPEIISLSSDSMVFAQQCDNINKQSFIITLNDAYVHLNIHHIEL